MMLYLTLSSPACGCALEVVRHGPCRVVHQLALSSFLIVRVGWNRCFVVTVGTILSHCYGEAARCAGVPCRPCCVGLTISGWSAEHAAERHVKSW